MNLSEICKLTTPVIMGIVNLTGDSFSEGAKSAAETGFERAEKLIANGARIIDLGGESTRPRSVAVGVTEELARVLPTLDQLRAKYPKLIISVDTRHAEVAEKTLEHGADIINDVGMLRDEGIIAAVAKYHAGLVICHSCDDRAEVRRPYLPDVVSAVSEELREAAERAVAGGVEADKIWYDPGCGFNKTEEENWKLIAEAKEFSKLGVTLYGVSRKSFIGAACGEKSPENRGGATLATELFLAEQGVKVLRTHDVRALRGALEVWKKLRELD